MKKRAQGQLRQSQIVTTFGPGALLDLPKHSCLVSGLEHWGFPTEEIVEPRLVDKLRRILGVPQIRLYPPPRALDDPGAPSTGIKVWRFPEWFVTRNPVDGGPSDKRVRARALLRAAALTAGVWVDGEKQKQPVVAVRFVRACRKGHIGDIDWWVFVHAGRTDCKRPIWMDEGGTTGDLSEIQIRCDCGATRALIEAARMENESKALGHCDGSRPWLGPRSHEPCGEPNRLLIRTASNAYFPQLMSVISLPERPDVLASAIEGVWEMFLQYVETVEELAKDRERKPPVRMALEGHSNEAVWSAIQSRRGGQGLTPQKSVKLAEFETLSSAAEEIGEDRPDGLFYARRLPAAKWRKDWMAGISQVVLVHRLREVVAQVGFTRFESISPDSEGELEIGVQSAALSREPTWLPAYENRGEGVFIQFANEAIGEWMSRAAVRVRGEQLLQGFELWRASRKGAQEPFRGVPYVMLHTLAHLLCTAVALECGYPASSIRERVYALSAGYGILLYTGTPDAEGTMGGLVEAGRRLERHLSFALELAALCSNDPVCAQHSPEEPLEHRFLHGAACHGCVLISETSCEVHNEFLDRALVVPTVTDADAAFFGAR